MTFEFEAWPKIPRLRRDILITEKIDGTNACIMVDEGGNVGAQSRTRIITPLYDNYGFAAWVDKHADVLRDGLGIGRHYGEWWGNGIQRGYGLTVKRFSLFNTKRWYGQEAPELLALGVDVVPVLASGPMNDETINYALAKLKAGGSAAAPGFMQPEGVVVFHLQSRQMFKVLLENDGQPKSAVA